MSLKQWSDNGWLKTHKTSKEEIEALGDYLATLTPKEKAVAKRQHGEPSIAKR